MALTSVTGSRVRGAEGGGFDAGEEHFIAFASKRRDIGVRNADAVGVAGMRQMDAFHGLAEAPAKADGDDEVLGIYSTDEVSDASRGGGREYGKAKQE